MEQTLRKLSAWIEPSGTATLVENTKLYKGGYAFVLLKALVPVTQNRAENTRPVCTVHAVTIDQFGTRKQVDNKFYNMRPVETTTVNGFEYIIFERKMPKTFTDTAGDLELIYNYSEITAEGKLAARLPTNILHLTVEEGGEADGEIDVDIDLEAVAQINKNTIDIELLKEDFTEYRTSTDFLFQPIDNSEANKVGNARVVIENGRLKIIEFKGEQGETGETGPMPDHRWDETAISFEKPDGTFDQPVNLKGPMPNHFWQGPVLYFELPSGGYDSGSNLVGPAGPPGPSVAAGMSPIKISSEMWSYDTVSKYYWLIITPEKHGLGETLHLFASALPTDGSNYVQTADSFTFTANGVVGATARVPWSGYIRVMGGASEAIDTNARGRVSSLEDAIGAANGIATLDGNKKVPLSQLPDGALSGMAHLGEFNAATGVSTLTSNGKTLLGTTASTVTLTNNTAAVSGYPSSEHGYHITQTAGTFAGIELEVGDWLVANATGWGKIDNTDAVQGVNGQKGNVVLTAADVGALTKSAADISYMAKGEGYTKAEANTNFATTAQGIKADAAYTKPGTGIPKADLNTAVQASLNKADSAMAKSVYDPQNKAQDIFAYVDGLVGDIETALDAIISTMSEV